MPDNSEIENIVASIKSKRARIFVQHILEHGQVTTEDMLQYGYKHAPRAARDVREAGIPLETFSIKDSQGKSIAAYRLGDVSQIRRDRLAGRRTFSKALKAELSTSSKNRCGICGNEYPSRYLQIDHRVPYEVSGDFDVDARQAQSYMLLCGSCNRAKSWSCENCDNWNNIKDANICLLCYWANSENYSHVATFPERRMTVVWNGEEVKSYEWITVHAEIEGKTPQDFVKYLIKLQQIR